MQLNIDTIDKHYKNIYYIEKDKDGNEVKKMRLKTEKECNHLKYKVECDCKNQFWLHLAHEQHMYKPIVKATSITPTKSHAW